MSVCHDTIMITHIYIKVNETHKKLINTFLKYQTCNEIGLFLNSWFCVKRFERRSCNLHWIQGAIVLIGLYACNWSVAADVTFIFLSVGQREMMWSLYPSVESNYIAEVNGNWGRFRNWTCTSTLHWCLLRNVLKYHVSLIHSMFSLNYFCFWFTLPPCIRH